MTGHQIALALGEHSIRQIDGLFSLNDLHRASGADAHKRPGEFVRLDTTRALVAEIQIAGNPAITAKPKIGTYACRDLVIAYAAWISAAFHLKVIRVFLSATVPAQPAQPSLLPPASAPQVPAFPTLDLDLIKTASEAASKVAHEMFAEVFDAMIHGKDATHCRWLLAFAHDRQAGAVPYVRRMNDEAIVVSLAELPSWLLEPGALLPTNKELAAIAAACNQKLIQRIEGLPASPLPAA